MNQERRCKRSYLWAMPSCGDSLQKGSSVNAPSQVTPPGQICKPSPGRFHCPAFGMMRGNSRTSFAGTLD